MHRVASKNTGWLGAERIEEEKAVGENAASEPQLRLSSLSET
jgi:hypothetical protein